MMTELEYFEHAISLEKYMVQMESNQEKTYAIYEKFDLPEDPELLGLLKQKQPKILAITEDWSGDAMMVNPILRKLAEAADVEVRCVYRDDNPELMERHFTNSGKSIPKYVFLSQEGDVVGAWGPRSPKVQKMVEEKKAKLPEETDPHYKLHWKTVIGEISDRFTSDPELWQDTYEDLSKSLQESLA
ncbi:thioredoxin family protein [Planococcus sp. ISL-109]|uniref:thioredoxin family protein n=1 Tax=Planococcus sp. ISL-109 TaxID=2819166 RepID=UPI001BE94A7D|nr:thioredoxin family protein [Planococcus sp. ISL-109]MBT2584111.1 thioredoxin family protein [Planococcus sp. ISL-109]